jgi:hypothetical protein
MRDPIDSTLPWSATANERSLPFQSGARHSCEHRRDRVRDLLTAGRNSPMADQR